MSSGGRGATASAAVRKILILFLAAILLIGLASGLAYAQTQPMERSESVALRAGDWISVSSNRNSLQHVEIRGNLTASKLSSPQHYPANIFNFTSSAQGDYTIRLAFSYPLGYDVAINVNSGEGGRQEEASYYVSSGELLLTIDADFEARDSVTAFSGSSLWGSFLSWTTRFGDAFPLWVKLLYVLLGIQFLAVGYKWVEFENSARGEDSPLSRFDRGNLLYLGSEIFFKFLFTAFLVIAVAMGGQLILLTVLNLMFLAPVSMLTLWDLFVLGFAAGITAIAYALRFSLERFFDLKPLSQE